MGEIPRWLELTGEISWLQGQLKLMLEDELNLSELEKAIDQSTGYDKVKIRKGNKIINRIKKLQGEVEDLTSVTKSNEK